MVLTRRTAQLERDGETPRRVRPPPRLLNTSTKAKATNPIAILNAEQSPLLALPAEIRNRIYNYVLGGKTFHVGLVSSRMSVCRLPHLEAPAMKKLRLSKDTEAKIDKGMTYVFRHFLCDRENHCAPRSAELALLSTCTQVHREAALLPFALNTFALRLDTGIGHRAEKAFDELAPFQQRAVRSVTIISYRPYLPPALSKRLIGLKSILVLIEGYDGYPDVPPSDPAEAVDVLYWQERFLRSFDVLKVEDAEVHIGLWPGRRDVLQLYPKTFNPLCLELEARLLSHKVAQRDVPELDQDGRESSS